MLFKKKLPVARLSIFLLELYAEFYNPHRFKELLDDIQISVDDWPMTATEWSMFILFSVTMGMEGNFADMPDLGREALHGFFEEIDKILVSGGLAANELPEFHKQLHERINEYKTAWHSAADSSVVEKLGCAVARNVLGLDPDSSAEAYAFGKSAVTIFLGPARALKDLKTKVSLIA